MEVEGSSGREKDAETGGSLDRREGEGEDPQDKGRGGGMIHLVNAPREPGRP